MGLGCCVAAIYFAASAALDRPDVLRLGAEAATSPLSQADYSVDPEQARRPPLNPQIFGAIAVDEDALRDADGAGGAPPDGQPPSGAAGSSDDRARSATNTPRPNATDPPDDESTGTPTAKPEATATRTPRPEPTPTNTENPKPTETNTPEPEPTSTKTPPHTATKTPTPTKTPKHAPTATDTPQTEPPPTNTPTRCRKADLGTNQHGNGNNGKRRACPTPTPTLSTPG
jgi:outer membrane biosynthesis protein TonB